MRKISLIIFLSLCLFVSCAWAQGIRKAVWAGQFYEKKAEILSQQIDQFLENAKKTPPPSEEILALIAPHAGYVYSGQTAAYSYRLIQGKDYESVMIIAPSHRYGFKGCSIYSRGGYETPLGVVEIDEPLAAEISKASGYKYVPKAHQMEHSVEVQIPFIQKTLPQAKIVPIVMGYPTRKTITNLAEAMIEVLPGKKVLIIASTDMSHFLPKKKANDTDFKTISLIQSFQTSALLKRLERGENIMCGGGPVVSSLFYAQERGEAKAEILHYADSSPLGGESQVVGYLAAALYSKNLNPNFSLSLEEKTELLRLARSAINQFIREKKIINYSTENLNFLAKKGAFVTLKRKGYLRGCIGFIEPVAPLYQTVIHTSVYAACRDQRFPPVSAEELDDLEIEISVLSPLKKIHDPSLVRVGKHGLVISKGNKKGLLLPQVPVENNWSRETFLKQACMKAGLPPNTWKSGADIYIFEAIILR
ncbi:MAG: AmmeMemoRadiSam system protein B [Candidatus Aminicenantes bacterium]|nr:AmmeMemoRadiSam system protein B [Candidatus Aminicenantes bacterium]